MSEVQRLRDLFWDRLACDPFFSAGTSARSLALWNPLPDDGGDVGIVALAAAT
jgi:hypothetical protein